MLFASDPSLATEIAECASDDLLARRISNSAVTYEFRFMASRDRYSVRGRQVRLDLPPGSLEKLTGDLALLVTSAEKDVIDADLLFASDAELGNVVRAGMPVWLRVDTAGNGRGLIFSALYLRFRDGELHVFSQSHFASQQPDAASELVAARFHSTGRQAY